MRYLKNDFSKGIVSPAIQSRVDSENYIAGVKDLENFIVLPTGGLANRPGTYGIAANKDNDYNSIVRGFSFGNDNNYILEFGHQYIRFFKNGSVIGAPYEVATPYDETELYEIKFAQDGDIIYIQHQNHQTRKLTRTSDAVWTLTTYDYIHGPFMPLNTDSSLTITPSAMTGTIQLTASSAIFSNITDSDHSSNRTLWQINRAIEEQHTQSSLTVVGQTSSLKCGGTWRLVTQGTWVGTLSVEMSIDGGSTWNKLRTFSSAVNANYNTYGTEEGEQFLIRANLTTLSSGTCVIDLSTDAFIWKGYVKITEVPFGGSGSSQMYTTAEAEVIETLADTNATNDWAEGSWSQFRGYPQTIAFNQGRLCFAGTTGEPQTIWLSETNFYESFIVHSPIRDSDSISVTIQSYKYNEIRNIIPINDLLILTSAGEWSLTSENGILTPNTVAIVNNGYSGSAKLAPVMILNRAVYVQNNLYGIRDTGFDFESNGFKGITLSDDAEQLFEGHSIIDIAFQQNPFPIIWCVRDDGVLLTCTYKKEIGMFAWALQRTYHKYAEWDLADEDELPKFKSVTVIPGDGYDEVWFTVNRPRSYPGKEFTIERMLTRTLLDRSEVQNYIDCAYYTETTSKSVVAIDNVGNAFYVTGHGYNNGDKVKLYNVLDRLNLGPGDSYYTVVDVATDYFSLYYDDTTNYVDITADEDANYVNYSGHVKILTNTTDTADLLTSLQNIDIIYDGQLTTDNFNGSGVATLDAGKESAYITAGFRYPCRCELLPPIFGMNDGTMLGMIYSINNLLMILHETIGGKAGYSFNNLSPLLEEKTGNKFGKNYQTDKWIPNAEVTTDHAKNSVETLQSTNTRVFIEQEEPYPFELLAVVMFIDIGGE